MEVNDRFSGLINIISVKSENIYGEGKNGEQTFEWRLKAPPALAPLYLSARYAQHLDF